MPKGDPQRGYTHCVNGHEFTEENTRISTNAAGYTQRNCRACKRIAGKNAYDAVSAAARLRGSW
jgi:hypothetical protein